MPLRRWYEVRPPIAGLLLAVLAGGCAGLPGAPLEDLLVRREAPFDEATVASGLREALRVGAQRAVRHLAREDGIRADPLARTTELLRRVFGRR